MQHAGKYYYAEELCGEDASECHRTVVRFLCDGRRRTVAELRKHIEGVYDAGCTQQLYSDDPNIYDAKLVALAGFLSDMDVALEKLVGLGYVKVQNYV